MVTQDILNLITTAFSSLGVGMIAILSLFVGIGVAYLVFKFGWYYISGQASVFGDFLGSPRSRQLKFGDTSYGKGFYTVYRR